MNFPNPQVNPDPMETLRQMLWQHQVMQNFNGSGPQMMTHPAAQSQQNPAITNPAWQGPSPVQPSPNTFTPQQAGANIGSYGSMPGQSMAQNFTGDQDPQYQAYVRAHIANQMLAQQPPPAYAPQYGSNVNNFISSLHPGNLMDSNPTPRQASPTPAQTNVGNQYINPTTQEQPRGYNQPPTGQPMGGSTPSPANVAGHSNAVSGIVGTGGNTAPGVGYPPITQQSNNLQATANGPGDRSSPANTQSGDFNDASPAIAELSRRMALNSQGAGLINQGSGTMASPGTNSPSVDSSQGQGIQGPQDLVSMLGQLASTQAATNQRNYGQEMGQVMQGRQGLTPQQDWHQQQGALVDALAALSGHPGTGMGGAEDQISAMQNQFTPQQSVLAQQAGTQLPGAPVPFNMGGQALSGGMEAQLQGGQIQSQSLQNQFVEQTLKPRLMQAYAAGDFALANQISDQIAKIGSGLSSMIYPAMMGNQGAVSAMQQAGQSLSPLYQALGASMPFQMPQAPQQQTNQIRQLPQLPKIGQ